jgi:hypothetical protein
MATGCHLMVKPVLANAPHARGRDIFRLLRASTLTGTFSLVPTIIVPIGATPFHLRRREVARVYRCHWKIDPIQMAIVIGFRVWIEMRLNKRVVVRMVPDEPNPRGSADRSCVTLPWGAGCPDMCRAFSPTLVH